MGGLAQKLHLQRKLYFYLNVKAARTEGDGIYRDGGYEHASSHWQGSCGLQGTGAGAQASSPGQGS